MAALEREGIIFKAVSGAYDVDTESGLVRCKARGRFRKEGVTPLVGDRVRVSVTEDGSGRLEEILPRKNAFIRPPVANIDKLVIFASAVIPVTDPFLVDRIAAIAELKNCTPVICINKSDLDAGDALYAIYSRCGFPTIRTSAVTGEGLEKLQVEIAGSVCAFTGNSGVGKSSILNALDPGRVLQVGEVSEKLGRGRHTTRHVQLFRLPCGAVAADTPGFSAFDTDRMELTSLEMLSSAFREFAPYTGKCRFQDCRHVHEPGCAVLQALADGKIAPTRHASYVRLYEQVRLIKAWELKD